MKTKKIVLSCITVLTAGALVLNSCKKEEEASPTPDTTNQEDINSQSQKASDDSEVEGNSNATFDDANKAIDSYSGMSGKKEANEEVCGAMYDTSQIANKILFINFDSSVVCTNGTTRSGQIKLQLPLSVQWKDVNAVLTVTYNNYKVTRVSDNKSMTFNGVATLKNTSGGTIFNLLTGDSLIHQARMNDLAVTFDDGTIRNWSGAWKRTVSGALVGGTPVITVSVVGDTTLNGVEHTESWGLTREGDPFTTTLNPPVVFNTTCLNKAISGGKTITVTNATIGTFVLTITVGVNSDGTATTSGCPYGYKLNWNNIQGQPQQLVQAYQ